MAVENKYSLINRLDMRSINNELTYLFQKYSMVLNKIVGDELIGNSQIREIYAEDNGVYKEYSKGQIRFKNGIDTLRYLLDHRASVAKLIGVSAEEINENKRNLAKVKDYLNKLRGVCEMGDVSSPLQMYISKHDGNIGGLDSSADWIDYILTQAWIDKLANRASGGEYTPTDYRIEYLADLIEGKMADHEIDYHKSLAEFDPGDFLSKSVVDGEVKYKVEDAMNRLNSFGKLDYGFYEIFKPIGGGKGKHVKVKVSTNGYVDVSGVVGLSDCVHWEWEYGSEAYLRSLNTGNQRYLLQLDMPINDKSSTLWWKPDGTTPPEKIEVQPSEDDTPQPSVWNYKPYETERFLRWYGNDHLPSIDESTLEKCTVCSSPELSSDAQSDDFHTDARNIGEMDIDLTTANIDASTSQSLLSLYPKATLAVRTYVCETDEDGKKTFREPDELDDKGSIHQYLEFVVTGNRQTYNVSFEVRGKMASEIQEPSHYLHTMEEITGEWHRLFNAILFLKVGATIAPEIEKVWNNLKSGYSFNEPWVPSNWEYLDGTFHELLASPTIIDILRFRQLDMEAIIKNNDVQYGARISGIEVGGIPVEGFLKALSTNNDEEKKDYIDTHCNGDEIDKNGLYSLVKNKMYLKGDEDDESSDDRREYLETYKLRALKKYIDNFESASSYEELDKYYTFIGLTDTQKENLVRQPLVEMYGDKDAKKDEKEDPLAGVTVDSLRESITTFNNLVVRLPVDSEHNCLVSKRIFQDWWEFFDRARHELVKRGELFVNYKPNSDEWLVEYGIGTNGEEYPYTELYIDKNKTIKLVDYSYIVITDEKANFDRWDYWTVDDFNWPQ